MKLKAFIFSGNHHQYENFIRENHLDRREYPMLNEDNWRGLSGVGVIRIGTFFENSKMLDMLPHIENSLHRESPTPDAGRKDTDERNNDKRH